MIMTVKKKQKKTWGCPVLFSSEKLNSLLCVCHKCVFSQCFEPVGHMVAQLEWDRHGSPITAYPSQHTSSFSWNAYLMMMLLITNVLQNQRRDGVKLYGKQILWNHLYLASRGATAKTHRRDKKGLIWKTSFSSGKEKISTVTWMEDEYRALNVGRLQFHPRYACPMWNF